MSLREYKRKRHFTRTPEPKGKKGADNGRSFVIQKHAARQLHYDFRLELDGVLKSWAVPKGPSLDPAVKRLAMHVEDHPVEYGSFEGVIPAGEYGGGTVMLWDQGDWEPVGDAHEGYRSGKLKFKLNGQKLHGAWMLVRTGGKAQVDKDQRQWLLFKERDGDAKPADEGDVLSELPLSVSTGRSLEEIAAARDWVWGDKAKSPEKPKAVSARSKKTAKQGETYDARKKQFAGVRMTNPDKVMYAEGSITKIELANYYRTIAEWILPQIKNRPLVLVRCPDGQRKQCFYQKHPGVGTPDTLRQIPYGKTIQPRSKTSRKRAVSLLVGENLGRMALR
jgi:bifunctional non-homologous end joining protein LigD